MWNEALDQAGVEASFTLRRAENVYYPPAIRASSSLSSKASSVSEEADEGKESPIEALPTANISPEAAEQFKVVEKAVDTTKEVAYDAQLPLATPKEPPQGERGFPQNVDCASNSSHTLKGRPQR